MPKKNDVNAILAAVAISAFALALSYSYHPSQVACTMDAKICPDGTAVGRVPPSCEFAPCPISTQYCDTGSDCVPAQCCHPSACINKDYAPDCSAVSCTASCEGPLDCGAGSCGCVNGVCVVE